MAKVIIEQCGSFRTAGEIVLSGKAQIAVVRISEINCHVVVAKQMEESVQKIVGFFKAEPTNGLATFFVLGRAPAIIEKLRKRLLESEVLPVVGEERKYLDGQITVLRRPYDYMAYISGNKTRWEAGKSTEEAIGKLVKNQMS